MDAPLVQEAGAPLGADALFRVVERDVVASTNDVVKRAIEAGEPEGLAVRARRQTGGYGRQGRAWESPVGGLYFSMLLRPKVDVAQLPTLALVAGMAVRSAAADLLGEGAASAVKVKWPNDIVVDDPGRLRQEAPAAFRKLCGISSELHRGALCVGVGVNVHRPSSQDGLPASSGKNAPVYLAELLAAAPNASADPLGDALFRRILAAFAPRYALWQRGGFSELAGEYAEHEALRGRLVAIEDMNGSLLAQGTVEGVASDGRLLVRRSDGSVVGVASGEAHVRG